MVGTVETRYKRLPGRGPRRQGFIAGSLSKCSLFLGDDHLLAVDSNGFSEDYKHFYFSEIQAIVTRKTRRGIAWSIVLALMLVSSLMGGLFLETYSIRILSWIFSGTFLVFLGVNLFKGPTCVCHILTAVQEDQLPSLNRLRVARRVINTLTAAIEKAQGILDPEKVNASESEGFLHPKASVQQLRTSRGRNHPIRHDNGTVHMITFAFMLTDGILTGIILLHHTMAMTVVSSLLTAAYCICIVVALVKQYETDIPVTVRRITWASLGFICVSYFLSYFLMILTIPTLMKHRPHSMLTQWDMYRAMFYVSPQDSPPVMVVYAFAATCSLVLGTLGFLRVKKHHDHSAGVTRFDPHSGGELRV